AVARSSCARRSWTSSAPTPGRGPRSPSRSPTGSGCGCTGAPSSGCAGGERPVVLAAGRGGPGRLRNAARARVRALRAADRSGRGPVRPSRAGRVDRLGCRRAGVRRRTARRCPAGLDTARGSAGGGAGRGLPVPARRRRTRGFGCRTGTTGQGPAVRAALYARVSTEAQADRGTIGSQLALLREHIAAAGDELVGEYVDDGHSGARLDRPGLDALRDAAEAGLVQRVWCLSPDRLARAYAYQVLVLDELDRFGVAVAFTDSPGLAADDPQSILLTQVQGVIAEYEKAKIAERYRRGKLFRARAGEIVTWKSPYGYRRIPRSDATGQAHHEIYEPEAAVVRRIFTDRAAGISVREICRRLNADAIPSPTGKPTWGTSTICRLLRNEAYVGRVY